MAKRPQPTDTVVILLFFLFLFLASSHAAAFPGDAAALRAFKAGINPSSIPDISCLATWNFSAVDPCAVPKVTYFMCAVTCSAGRIVQITLDRQGYQGTLTPLVSNLTGLIYLDLGNNKFSGPIPDSMSSLPNLASLILRSNSFSGTIPPSIGRIASLITLDLSRNSLSGALPDMSQLEMLTRLDLSYNNFSGPINGLPPKVNELALKNNSLSGPLLQPAFARLTRLMVVELSENSLSGILGAWFFLLPDLQQANLAKNSFKAIAVEKPTSSELVAVDLSNNQIEGLLPVNFLEYPSLNSLSLSNNQFRGPIPLQFGGKRLQRLYLDGNFLNSSLPQGFFSDGGPKFGSLADNCLAGCPETSSLCQKPQKPASICRRAYGGK